MKTVHLDYGHGGKDSGAVGSGLLEKDVVLSVGGYVTNILQSHDVRVTHSRTTDDFVELSKRASEAIKNKADVFVSIHCNDADNKSAMGVEVFHQTNKDGKLAKLILDSVISDGVFSKNRGVKQANFSVLRNTSSDTISSVLVELGFIGNATDAKILKDLQPELALAISKGILSYLGIKYNGGVNLEDKVSDWAKYGWDYATKEGLIDGTRPKDTVTREELAVIIQRLLERVK